MVRYTYIDDWKTMGKTIMSENCKSMNIISFLESTLFCFPCIYLNDRWPRMRERRRWWFKSIKFKSPHCKIHICTYTYQKNEEHKEHERSEIKWSQNPVSFLNLCEVDVTQNDAKLGEAMETKQNTMQNQPGPVVGAHLCWDSLRSSR